jgi:hypothetical protein
MMEDVSLEAAVTFLQHEEADTCRILQVSARSLRKPH